MISPFERLDLGSVLPMAISQGDKHEDLHQGIPGLFEILPNGSIIRSEFIASIVAPSDHAPPEECLSRDVLINSQSGLQARIFLPAASSSCLDPNSLPLIVYFHGGGFCMFSAKTSFIHDFCAEMAKAATALVISLDYRLAPEHPLPAAYDDAMELIRWLTAHYSNKKDCASSYQLIEPWISAYADLSSCFLMGENSGANILHHVMIRRSNEKLLPISGLILVHPFFGGEERTPSEIKFAKNDYVAPVELLEEFWRYCLPVGANRDHCFSNPFNSSESNMISTEFPRTVVVVGGRNSLLDRQVEYFNMMKKSGKDVLLLYLKNAQHAFEFSARQIDQANILLQFITQFMFRNNEVM